MCLWLNEENCLEIQADHRSFRSYMSFFAGQQVSLLGSSVAQFVVIWWITIQTQSTWYLALAMIAGFAPMIALTPLAGVHVDRSSARGFDSSGMVLVNGNRRFYIGLFRCTDQHLNPNHTSSCHPSRNARQSKFSYDGVSHCRVTTWHDSLRGISLIHWNSKSVSRMRCSWRGSTAALLVFHRHEICGRSKTGKP